MKIVMLTLAMLFGIPAEDDTDVGAALSNTKSEQCISADKIIKPMLSWSIVSTEFIKNKKGVFIEVHAHNPLSKRESKFDAKFIFSVNASSGVSTSKYDLIAATFYNEKNIVIFNRIYEEQKVKLKRGIEKLRVQTLCFSREVQNNIQVGPIEIMRLHK